MWSFHIFIFSFRYASEPFAHGYPSESGSGGSLGETPKQLGAGRSCRPRPAGVNTIFPRENKKSLKESGHLGKTNWDAVIRVYDEAGKVIETHEQAGSSKRRDVSPQGNKRNHELVNVCRGVSAQ